jgi:predicted acyltransferase
MKIKNATSVHSPESLPAMPEEIRKFEMDQLVPVSDVVLHNSPENAITVTSSSERLLSLDALRGFDMFWILGGDALARALKNMNETKITSTISTQLSHVDWEGFRFYDMIFPLFVFMAGVSTVYSLAKANEQGGRARAMRRIFVRTILLFLCGIFYSGGFSRTWPDIRVLGVLQRIAIGYGGAALIYLFVGPHRPKTIIAITISILVGYWAALTFIPYPDIRLTKEGLEPLIAKAGGSTNPTDILAHVSTTTKGHYEKGYNLTNYIDWRYLPGRKYDTYFDPEGILSMIPAIASALLGIISGWLLRESNLNQIAKPFLLIAIGLGLAALGYQWGMSFPVIKKIWTSSFVLVAGGLSMALLGLFYLIIDVAGLKFWIWPFVWIGSNAITLYLLSNLMGFGKIAERLVGGDVSLFFNETIAKGAGGLIQVIVTLLLVIITARFLYRHKIFLRF